MNEEDKEVEIEVEVIEPEVVEKKEQYKWHDADGNFVKGNKAGGRPKGSRNKLTEMFWDDLYDGWKKEGPGVISKVIEKDPSTFLRCMVQVMPKELDVNVNRWDGISDAQLKQQFLFALTEARSLGIDIGLVSASGTSGEGETQENVPAIPGPGSTKT